MKFHHPYAIAMLLLAAGHDPRLARELGSQRFRIPHRFANRRSPAPRGAAHSDSSGWAELSEAQAMSVKQVLGRWLALSALANTYGRPFEWFGPWFRAMESTASGIRLKFDHLGGGLYAKGDQLIGFTIAGEDRKFGELEARIEDDSALVSSPTVAKPVAPRLLAE